MNSDDKPDQANSEDAREDTDDFTISINIVDDHLDNQQEVLRLGQACQNKLFLTSRVTLP
jgi:hypothetical protein